MINIFKTQPEWMQQDTRIGRPIVVPSPGKPGGDSLSYNINADFMYDRHRVMLPPELILVETDAPFLTPEPLRGRPNSPYLIGITLRAMAKVR